MSGDRMPNSNNAFTYLFFKLKTIHLLWGNMCMKRQLAAVPEVMETQVGSAA